LSAGTLSHDRQARHKKDKCYAYDTFHDFHLLSSRCFSLRCASASSKACRSGSQSWHIHRTLHSEKQRL
jgi:hypothetical protein